MTDGDFASYCRAVDSRRLSNGKQKGGNNAKCGTRYLSWAFVEAANFARRYDENCRRWYDRKAGKTTPVLATKALACKLAKAAWHVMARRTIQAVRGPIRGWTGLVHSLRRTTVGSVAAARRAGQYAAPNATNPSVKATAV